MLESFNMIKLNAENKISPLKVAANLSEYWSPQVIAEVDDFYVKVAKLKRQFV